MLRHYSLRILQSNSVDAKRNTRLQLSAKRSLIIQLIYLFNFTAIRTDIAAYMWNFNYICGLVTVTEYYQCTYYDLNNLNIIVK